MIDLSTWKKVWALLDARERRNAWIVLGIMLVAAISSAVMVGSIMPFLVVLADPARIEATPALAWAYAYFGFTSVHHFLVGLGAASFGVIVLASLVQIAKTWTVARYTNMRSHAISHRLLASYLAQPYPFFLNRHSGDMGSRVLVEAAQVVTRFLRPVADLVATSLTTVAIVALLLWVDPVVAVVAFAVLGGFYALVYLASRRVLNRLGHVRVNANRQRYRFANEALTGIKDIKLVGREKAYLGRFAVPSTEMAHNEIKIEVLSQVPQFVLQAVGLGGVILLCTILIDPTRIESGGALGGLLPILGVFAFAGQRLLPELSKLYSALTQMQAGAAAVNVVYEDLVLKGRPDQLPGEPSAGLGLSKTLSLEGIFYSYPNAAHVGLRNISLSIRAGEKIGIVGSTGAGKTTLADLILGLLEPDQGRMVVDQTVIDASNQRAWMQSVGYVPQDIFLTDAPVAENIALGIAPEAIDMDRLRRAARIARIDTFITQDLPDGYRTHVGERGVRLSGGQRQRIGIARALYHDADLIVFDEATSALDNLTEQDVMDAIDALPGDKTVLMIAHRLSTVKHCDRIIVLDRGEVVGYDSWDALMAGNPAFQRIARLGQAA
ncbi:MAG: ABC transporter ATP-binding protein [Parvibaculum sp.]|uniref:ABC transporter ATP-binding protein n=1 Tax=Parvibaculum sp. TaxID=2024848 RepID=UPI002720A0F6|nr:ABC transporter ATP-binding protein [Parvibaculum sp.]MDO8837356.1 ABC transporter ATP-binding protein [Parvibaculum sp.]